MLSALAAGVALAGSIASPQLTVYNQGFALVKETIPIQLQGGRQEVVLENVPTMIEATSVGIKQKSGPEFSVLEQNYRYDLINPMSILSKSVGKKVRITRTIGNTRDILTGTLLSSPMAIVSTADGGNQQTYNGMVVKTDDGSIVLDPTGEVEVEQVPEGMISIPSLVWDLQADGAGASTADVSFLTQGMSWTADYVLQLDSDFKVGDLKGWVTLNNNSGATYQDAGLQLLAGDVQRAPQAGFAGRGAGGAMMMKAADASTMEEQPLFEYHLYTLGRTTTIRNNEIKQLSLLEANSIQVTKKLIVDSMLGYFNYYPQEGAVGTGMIKPMVRVEFVNSKANHAGIPLPAGRMKVFGRDAKGGIQLLGEDNIIHTPKDETVSVFVGRSFDVVAERKRLDFRLLGPTVAQETFSIELRNHKETPETVTVLERHWADWNVVEKSMPFIKVDANTMEFDVPLKPGETKTIKYTVITRWG